jgi:YHS domain-containing protein
VNSSDSNRTSNVEWTECNGPNPTLGTPVQTACGSMVEYSANTPCVNFRGERVYFCLQICKADFDQNPLASCMASRLT